ncbi:SDR family oxidoreductase [Nocardia macrotermitis]|uniref:Uncharacterized protein n=1 Tax=Nocardia macrotermitis TaxID=2585198 RepID=A0A7K0D366_9NOCA|nr:SDR family oxidoreductase [Nocardia macrotermitis]MQY20170.1 hypothetical protein [Nocardia macrotermitis]
MRPDPAAPQRDPLPLLGRTAVVTGVSRRQGIGYAIARHLAAYGASLFLHHHTPHDAKQPWGADPAGPQAITDDIAELQPESATIHHLGSDLAIPDAPDRLFDAARKAHGHIDILICNHGRSGGDGPLESMDARWLATDESAWITGQVINSEGGFRR